MRMLKISGSPLKSFSNTAFFDIATISSPLSFLVKTKNIQTSPFVTENLYVESLQASKALI